MLYKRLFGKSGVSLSPITLGTMRFSKARIGGEEQGVALLEYLCEKGINTYHTSHEYDTHSFFCEAFKKFRKKNLAIQTVHIVKLAAPHFEENSFSYDNLNRLIDSQLYALGIEQIDIVQWLFRQKNNVDEVRIPKLIESIGEIEESFQKILQSGKVKVFACFPYSLPFARIINDHNLVSGFIDYLNLVELHWAEVLQAETIGTNGFIALRPLYAGKILKCGLEQKKLLSQLIGKSTNQSELVTLALSYPLLHKNVASIVLSISDFKQADTAIKSIENILPNGDEEAFIKTTNFMTSKFF